MINSPSHHALALPSLDLRARTYLIYLYNPPLIDISVVQYLPLTLDYSTQSQNLRSNLFQPCYPHNVKYKAIAAIMSAIYNVCIKHELT